MSAVTGRALAPGDDAVKSVDAATLRARPVAAVEPLPGQVLAWNGSTSAWTPAPAVPSGTWCGNSASGVRCQGHFPSSSCPGGYRQDFLGLSSGEVITYFCVKR